MGGGGGQCSEGKLLINLHLGSSLPVWALVG